MKKVILHPGQMLLYESARNFKIDFNLKRTYIFEAKPFVHNLLPLRIYSKRYKRLPHGRPQDLVGDFYTNIFVHFKPSNISWFTKDNLWKYE